MIDGRSQADDHAGKADHRSHREIEFAADHQERGRGGKDADFCRNLQDLHDAFHREHAAVAGKGIEYDIDEDRPGQGAQFRPLEQL